MGNFFLCFCILLWIGASDSFLTQGEKQQILNKHNTLRAGEGASDMIKMEWDEGLAQWAQHTADKCQKAHSDFNYRGKSIGQNYYWWSANTDIMKLVQGWFDEKKNYPGGIFKMSNCRPGKMCGHYTQMAWAKSRYLGCAKKMCGDGLYLFCDYRPPGNWENKKVFTRGAPCSQCPAGLKRCSNGLCSA